jgi:hypothetical protein
VPLWLEKRRSLNHEGTRYTKEKGSFTSAGLNPDEMEEISWGRQQI